MAPALTLVGTVLVYPSLRAMAMSLYDVPSLTAPMDDWRFVGLQNYVDLFSIRLYRQSLVNIAEIWLISGVFTIGIAFLLASALTSNIRFRRIFTTIIYLPQVISVLALGYIWLLFVYNPKFGLFSTMAGLLPLEAISRFRWTSPDHIFLAMVIAGIFASIGQFTLMYIAALKKVPPSLYEAARIEGANRLSRLFDITLPLVRNETKSILLIFSIATINYLIFPLIFTSVTTITPMLFTYDQIFGTELDATVNVGVGAASTVVLLAAALAIFVLNHWVIRDAEHHF